jgi:hypothetical protein
MKLLSVEFQVVISSCEVVKFWSKRQIKESFYFVFGRGINRGDGLAVSIITIKSFALLGSDQNLRPL